MYADLAISPGAGLPWRGPWRGVAVRHGLFAMNVPRAAASAAPSDFARLLQAIVERHDQNSFAALFDYYAPRVKAYLKRLGASDSLAEDLAQEVMLTVWRKAEVLRFGQGRGRHLDLHHRPQPAHRRDPPRAPARARPGRPASRPRSRAAARPHGRGGAGGARRARGAARTCPPIRPWSSTSPSTKASRMARSRPRWRSRSVP